MPVVDFETVSDELESAEYVRVMSALIRSNLMHGADNVPAMVILTDKAMFYGGSVAMSGRFHRVPLRSVVSFSKAGKLIWECVEVRHMELEGEKTVYICPFKGSAAIPLKDSESMDTLLAHLGQD